MLSNGVKRKKRLLEMTKSNNIPRGPLQAVLTQSSEQNRPLLKKQIGKYRGKLLYMHRIQIGRFIRKMGFF